MFSIFLCSCFPLFCFICYIVVVVVLVVVAVVVVPEGRLRWCASHLQCACRVVMRWNESDVMKLWSCSDFLGRLLISSRIRHLWERVTNYMLNLWEIARFLLFIVFVFVKGNCSSCQTFLGDFTPHIKNPACATQRALINNACARSYVSQQHGSRRAWTPMPRP